MSLPQIKYPEYHDMSFGEIDKIREQISAGQLPLVINQHELLLYLNQMEPKYSSKLKWIQNISILFFVGTVAFIFIKWWISPILLVFAAVANRYDRSLANKFIFKQCAEDKVFLKFALATGLVKTASQSDKGE